MNACRLVNRNKELRTSSYSLLPSSYFLVPTKVFFLTLGCKVNQYESEAMQKLFTAAGWEVAEEISAADAPETEQE